jgi:hypothetical protein
MDMNESKSDNDILPESVIDRSEQKGIDPEFTGQQHYNWYSIGSGGGDRIIKTLGWNFSTPTPSIVLCQARQTENQDYGWSDQFSIQVIETGIDFVRIRIHRSDGKVDWGQNLRIDILVIE